MKNNNNYCLSVDIDREGNVKKESPAYIKECDPNRSGQIFMKTPNSQLQYKSNNFKLSTNENQCLTAQLDNSLKLDKCNPLKNNQKWSLEEMPSTFCMSSGSIVYYLDNYTFVRESKSFPGDAINVPVENLLQEEYDYNNIHAYVSATIVSINKEKREVLYTPNNKGLKKLNGDKLLRISLKEAIQLFVLDFTPPEDKLKIGTRVIV